MNKLEIGYWARDLHGETHVVKFEEYAALKAENEKLRVKLSALVKETSSFLLMADAVDQGHTNIAVLNHHIEQARAALDGESK